MLTNFLKIAFRTIYRQKFYTLINLIGLSFGLIASLLILLYIVDEFSYDTFHENARNIYRVNLYGRMADQEFNTCYTSAPLAAGLLEEIPEIIDACRIAPWDDIHIKFDENSYTEKTVLVADSNYFSFFSFKLIHGDPNTVLKDPDGVVITESFANKVFGYTGETDNSPVGKTLIIGTDEKPFTVRGITEDPPINSHFHYTLILPMESWDFSRNSLWISNELLTYVQLNEEYNWKSVEEKFPELVEKNVGPQAQQALGITFDDFISNGGAYGFYLQPLLRIHLYSDIDEELEPGGNISTLYILIAVVIFILVIACINFMNLSTARFTGRAKEVGVRKSLGAEKKWLVLQFLNESFLLSLLSFVIALVIISVVINEFNSLSGKQLSVHVLYSVRYLIGLLLLISIVAIAAGSYPAFYLSSFSPTEVLKGKIRTGIKSGGVRWVLVTFQFFISLVLINCTLLIYKQLKHNETIDLGFAKENLLVIKNAEVLGPYKNTFKETILKVSTVRSASIVNLAPPDINYSDIFRPSGGTNPDYGFNYVFADEDLIATLNFKMHEGRFFSKDFPSDSNAVIINEAAVRMLGWDKPVGEKIQTHWSDNDTRNVIGVVNDFNFLTLKKEVSALVIFPGNQGNLMLVRIIEDNVDQALNDIESVWSSLAEGASFEYSFVEEDFNAKFRKEQQLGKILFLFTAFALFVAFIGLFGLSTFTAEQRSKEIGIRKVMGASSGGIVKLMSMEYLKLIAISFVAAVPVSYFIIKWWLNNFAYKTDIGIMSFIASGFMTLVIIIMSVAYQSFKAASRNPAESIQYE